MSNLFNSINMYTAFKPRNVMKDILCKFMHKIFPLQNNCIFCSTPCKDWGCVYISETGRRVRKYI